LLSALGEEPPAQVFDAIRDKISQSTKSERSAHFGRTLRYVERSSALFAPLAPHARRSGICFFEFTKRVASAKYC
jgi:hypothetical protein